MGCTNFEGVVRISHNTRTTQGVVRKFRTSLEQLSSEGHIFLIVAPNHTQFKALDSWLPELWNGIYHVENGLWEVLQKCERRLQLLSSVFFTLFSSSPLFFPCILWTTLAKGYGAPKLGSSWIWASKSFAITCLSSSSIIWHAWIDSQADKNM